MYALQADTPDLYKTFRVGPPRQKVYNSPASFRCIAYILNNLMEPFYPVDGVTEFRAYRIWSIGGATVRGLVKRADNLLPLFAAWTFTANNVARIAVWGYNTYTFTRHSCISGVI